MDKYDFNIRVGQLKKLVDNQDYETALKVTETIDLKKVNDTRILKLVSTVYKFNNMFDEEKEILLSAYEKSSYGKSFLRRLFELAIKENNLKEAQAYYDEFKSLSPDDPDIYLLKYEMLKFSKSNLDSRIKVLKKYNAEVLDEKYLYELALLQEENNDKQQALEIIDKIILLFAKGPYVDKALDFKINVLKEPLNDYQIDLIAKKLEESTVTNKEEVEELVEVKEDIEESIVESEERKESISFNEDVRDLEISQDENSDMDLKKEQVVEIEEVSELEEISANIKELINEEIVSEKEIENIKEVENEELIVKEDKVEEFVQKKDLEEDSSEFIYIDDEDIFRGLERAKELIKEIHVQKNLERAVIKITGSKLEEKSIAEVVKKIDGKDLLVEKVGDLSKEKFDELLELVKKDKIKTNLAFVDTKINLEKLFVSNTEVKEENIREEVVKEKENSFDVSDTEEEMEIDDFASYASEYASEIECVISGKSMLALYERIEMMQADKVALTKGNAKKLIQEVANRADNPSVFKTIKNIFSFSKKYDSDDRLILKEEHFFE